MLLVTLSYGTLEMCSFFSSVSGDRVEDNIKMGCMWSTYWLEVNVEVPSSRYFFRD